MVNSLTTTFKLNSKAICLYLLKRVVRIKILIRFWLSPRPRLVFAIISTQKQELKCHCPRAKFDVARCRSGKYLGGNEFETTSARDLT